MKSTRFFRPAISAAAIAAAVLEAVACGPYNPTIPSPDFFKISGSHRPMAAYDREENLLLWQELTSDRIPLADIEQAVYKDSKDCLYDNPGNIFYAYLYNTEDDEIRDFLYTAKTLEEQRAEFSSPWYYPQKRGWDDDMGEFSYVLRQCRNYSGERLKDRYALQAVRALFASGQYVACAEYADSAFAGFPDSNLMKRMAQRYVAGCMVRFGKAHEADSIFAMSGDIWSVGGNGNDRINTMARYNPAAPQLMEYIRCNAGDTVMMLRTLPVANRLLKDRRVQNKGDWNFLLAFVNNEYAGNLAEARARIYLALQQRFSSDGLRDHARAYKMLLDAKAGNTGTLIADLRWIEGKADPMNIDAEQWLDRCRNIIYSEWVPGLWKRQDYTTAIMLCAYADNIKPQIRDNEEHFNKLDFGSFSFQMMQSCTSQQLASVYSRMMNRTPLYDFLRRWMRTDRDYYYDVIGTVALREGQYARAESYLSLVSEHYSKTLNVDKDYYLARDPFNSTPKDAGGASLVYDKRQWAVVMDIERYSKESNSSAKLDFARKMRLYGQMMKHGITDDDRGLARLMYAVGRKNSFTDCWALTHYWYGDCSIFDPNYRYWVRDEETDRFDFLYYGSDDDETMAEFNREVDESLAMLTTDEARAKAQYMLGNLKTIARRYPSTTVGKTLSTTCDHWSQWL